MKELNDCAREEVKILGQIRSCLQKVQNLAVNNVPRLHDIVKALSKPHQACFEEINQLQHVAGILAAAKFLYDGYVRADDLKWFWNPYRVVSHDEPDLRAMLGSQIVYSAKITTSTKPVGITAKQMDSLFERLQKMEGALFYFVFSDSALRRAKTKVSKCNYKITVVRL